MEQNLGPKAIPVGAASPLWSDLPTEPLDEPSAALQENLDLELCDTISLPCEPLSLGSSQATLMVMTGPEAGRLLVLDDTPILIGRDPRSALCLDSLGVSRSHARVWRDDNQLFYLEDLGSKNGTRIGPSAVHQAQLHPGDHLQFGPSAVVRFDLRYALDAALQQTVYLASVRDPLTHALNREHFDRRLGVELHRCRRRGDLLSLLMIDVDGFKGLNDRFGHPAGDRILCVLVAALGRQLRSQDTLARYGGDELAVLTRGRGPGDAAALAARLCEAVACLPFVLAGVPLSVTISIGVASAAELEGGDLAAQFVSLADRRLYAAKSAGRNRFVFTG